MQLGHQPQPAQPAASIEESSSHTQSKHSIQNSSIDDSYEEIPQPQPQRLDSLIHARQTSPQFEAHEDDNDVVSNIDNEDYLIAMQLANSQSIRSIQSVEPPLPPTRTRPVIKTANESYEKQEVVEFNGDDDMLAALEYAQDPPSSPDSPSAVPSVPVTTTAPPTKAQSAFFPSSFTSSKAAVERAKLARERREKALKNPGKPRKLSRKRKSFGGKTANLHDAWAPSSDDDAEITSEEEEEEDDDQQSVIVPLKTRIQRAKEAEQLAREKQRQEEEEAAKVNSFGIPHDLLNDKATQEIESSPNQHTSPEEEHEVHNQV